MGAARLVWALEEEEEEEEEVEVEMVERGGRAGLDWREVSIRSRFAATSAAVAVAGAGADRAPVTVPEADVEDCPTLDEDDDDVEEEDEEGSARRRLFH